MDRYIGLDVHSQSCTLAVMSSTGKRLRTDIVETNGAALKQTFRGIAGTKHLCIEEGTQSAWIHELLQDEVDELVVMIAEKHAGPKDDARDAWTLAERLRTGAIKQRVFKGSGPYTELRAAVKSYGMLRGDVRRAKTRLLALYRSRGLMPPASEVYELEKRERWIGQLPLPQQLTAKTLGIQIDQLMTLWTTAEERLIEASKPHRIVKLLATAPGIGAIRAAQIVALVVTPHRFRTKRQFWAYCGLAIVTRSSADWVRDRHGNWARARTAQTRGLNRNRQPVLKEAFKGAAHQIAVQMTTHPLHRDYQRLLEAGTKPNLAMLTIARRLAAAVLTMWKHEEAYDAEKHRSRMIVPA